MNHLWMGLTVLSVAGILLFGWLLRKRLKALQEWKKEFQPAQMRFKYDLDEMNAELDEMGKREHELLRQFDWIFVPMLFYVGIALAIVTRNAAQYPWMGWVMYGLSAAGCVLGMLESVLLVGEKLTLKAARACSLLKWICFGIWVVGMFAGLFIRSTAL